MSALARKLAGARDHANLARGALTTAIAAANELDPANPLVAAQRERVKQQLGMATSAAHRLLAALRDIAPLLTPDEPRSA